MKASKTTLTSLVAGGVALLFGTSLANASLVLTLDDLTTVGIDVIVVDNADGGIGTVTGKGVSNFADGSATFGVVNYNGVVGTWTVNISTGVSDPVIADSLDLNSVNVSGGVGSLQIMLTDTGYTSPTTGLLSEIGGTTNGTVTASQSFDPNNAEFGIGTTINQGPFVGGAFSDTQGASFPLALGPYSLTETVTINHTAAGQITSFDYSSSVPEPASLGMLGLGLVGLGFAARRRRKTS